jgi:hypothetical protein
MVNPTATITRDAQAWIERRGVPPADVQPAIDAVVSIASAVAAAAADPQLSDVGRAFRKEQATKAAFAALDAHEATTAGLFTQYEQLQDAAARGPAVDVTPQDQSLIANWFIGLPRERQVSEYFAAIANDDHKTIAVIEGLTSALSPLDEPIRAKARERKLQRASAAKLAAIEALKNRIAARQAVALSARRLLQGA